MIASDGPPYEAILIAEAKKFTKSGLSVIPVDRTKRPTIAWARRQQEIPSDIELLEFENATGMGVVCGRVSGGLEVLDFDAKHYPEGRDFYQDWLGLLPDGLSEKLTLRIKTPSGGWHVPYRCQDITGNSKLAKVQGNMVVIETRGEGGYVATWPTPGYEITSGSWGKVPVLTPDERETVLAIARSLSEVAQRPYSHQAGPGFVRRPGDDFTDRTSWQEILEPHGWALAYERNGEGYWTRPGKRTKDGTSATTNYRGSDLLKVFTSNGSPFEPDATYTKFAAHAFLNHGGDMSAAARALGASGYGDQRKGFDSFETPNVLQRKQNWVTLDTLENKQIDWLLRPYIPLGEYTVLAGMPGVGKSTVIQQIGAAVTTGTTVMGMPVVQGSVVHLAYEQGLRTVTRPRYEQMGADLSRIICPDHESEDGVVTPYSLNAEGVRELDQNIQGRDVRLIIVDTGDAYFDADKSTNSQIDVGIWLNRLIAVARKHNAALVVLMHLNKAYGMDPLYRIAGSVTWGGRARSGLLCGVDPDDHTKAAMVHRKASVGPKGRALGYFIEDRGTDIGHFGWCETDLTAERICEAPQTTEMNNKKNDCKEWLLALLKKEGTMPSKEIENLAKIEGYSRNVLFAAKKEGGVKANKDGLAGGWSWSLPSDEQPPYWAN